MTTISHTRDVHIDAPVERVFAHLKEPENILVGALMGEDSGTIARVKTAPDDGVGSVYEWRFRALMIPFHMTITREEFVLNEKIVDRASADGRWIFTLAPEDGGTKLTATVEISSKVPGLARLEDKVEWKGDDDLDKMLAEHKAAIEA